MNIFEQLIPKIRVFKLGTNSLIVYTLQVISGIKSDTKRCLLFYWVSVCHKFSYCTYQQWILYINIRKELIIYKSVGQF